MTNDVASMPDPAAVHQAHAARLEAIDRLIAAPGPLEAADGEVLLGATAEGGDALGLASRREVAQDSEEALWGPLRSERLRVQVCGDAPGAALATLLDRWEALVRQRSEPDDSETAALITVPSRDTVLAPALVGHGLAPLMTVAIRPALLTPLGRGSGRGIRRADPDDLDALIDLAVEVNRYDAQFGLVTARPAVREVLGTAVRAHLSNAPGWTWVAEDDGRVIGFVQVQPPDQVGWIAGVATPTPVAYLGYAYVHPERRASGLGYALVDEAHRALDSSGVAATLLHHSLPNPLSTPFWARHGYRPLLTAWVRRPAVRDSG